MATEHRYKKLPFRKVARDFFLYSTYFPLYQGERQSLNPRNFILYTKAVVLELASTFSPYMRACVFEKTKDVVLRTDEDLFRFLLPWCLRIQMQNQVQALTAAMALIHEFLLYLQMNRLCYRFHFTAYKCADAVYLRLKEGLSEFEFYYHVDNSLQLIRPRTPADYKTSKWRAYLKKNKANLFRKGVENDRDEDFVLNEHELSLVAEDPTSGCESGSQEKDDDPLEFDLTPSAELMDQKVSVFHGKRKLRKRIRIASLLSAVPAYVKHPRTEPSSDCSSVSDLSSASDDPEDLQRFTEEYEQAEAQHKKDTSNDKYEFNFGSRTCFSKLEIYTSVVLKEALNKFGAEKFREKMMQRECRHCGIKCYKFSYDLFQKQLDLALKRKVREYMDTGSPDENSSMQQ